MDDKGFWDSFGRIAPVALQLIGALSKDYEAGGRGMSTITVAIPSPEDKGFWDYFNKIAPVALHVLGELTKSYDPGTKAFSTNGTKTAVSLDDIPPPTDKGFWSVFSQVAQVAVPAILAAL